MWAKRKYDHLLPVSLFSKELERSTGLGAAYPAKGRQQRGDHGSWCFYLGKGGLSHELTNGQLIEIKLRFRTGKEYVSKEEVISLFGMATKRPITQAHFNNDLVSSPFLKMFRYC